MSRNKNVDYTQYVHEFVDDYNVRRFAVASAIKEGCLTRYTQPHDKRGQLAHATSFVTYEIEHLGGYLTRKQALRRARYLFGGK